MPSSPRRGLKFCSMVVRRLSRPRRCAVGRGRALIATASPRTGLYRRGEWYVPTCDAEAGPLLRLPAGVCPAAAARLGELRANSMPSRQGPGRASLGTYEPRQTLSPSRCTFGPHRVVTYAPVGWRAPVRCCPDEHDPNSAAATSETCRADYVSVPMFAAWLASRSR